MLSTADTELCSQLQKRATPSQSRCSGNIAWYKTEKELSPMNHNRILEIQNSYHYYAKPHFLIPLTMMYNNVSKNNFPVFEPPLALFYRHTHLLLFYRLFQIGQCTLILD